MLVVAPAAGARPLLAVHGGAARFDALTGQQSVGANVFVHWGQGATWGSPFSRLFASMGTTPILSVVPSADLTPLAIARGAGDSYLAALNHSVAVYANRIYVRPMPEMTGWWNSYSAYTRAGRSKGAAYSPSAFRAAFRRIYRFVHGTMPGVEGLVPAPNVRVIWCPQAHGDPQVAGNTPQAFYPGDGYVDVVGDDPYDEVGSVDWNAIQSLYSFRASKPFAFPEWGEKGIDDARFVSDMAHFVRTHRRVELLAWWNGHWGGPYDLTRKPHALAAYRRLIVPLGG